MVAFIHERQSLTEGDIVVVACDNQCNVRLMDDANFAYFKQGQRHRYYGGFYRLLPARIIVPVSGYWNVVIDPGPGLANIRHQINYITRKSSAAA
jgi:hypothetical protein